MITIRPACSADAAAMAGLVATHFDSLIVDPQQEGAEVFIQSLSVAAFGQRLESSGYRHSIADDQGLLAGFAAIREPNHLYHLFVAKTHQEQGIGRQLWEELVAFSRANGNTTGFTVNSSPAAQVVYEKFGFKTTSSPKAEHGVIFIPMRLNWR